MRYQPEETSLVKQASSVAFENVTFRSPDGRRVFAGFDLKIEPGERVGLVGQSGGGKSTLFALLQRFYDLHGGRILIDGQDICRGEREGCRNPIALFPQDIAPFQRPIMEKIP